MLVCDIFSFYLEISDQNPIDYELGRLLARDGDKAGARHQLELVLSGKPLEVNKALVGKGKYSMEQALVMRTHAAVDALDKDRLL